jgi:hypothetical protein
MIFGSLMAPGTTRFTATGINCTDHATPLYPQKLALTSPTRDGLSFSVVRSQANATEFNFNLVLTF